MLAPQDPPANGSSSRETLMQSQLATCGRSPQGPVTAPSTQYVNNYNTPQTGTDSPYSTPTTPARSPHVQPSEFSPSASNPQAYSPTPTSTTIVSSYVPPPSPTPSHKGAYPVPEGYYRNATAAYSTVTADGTSSQQYNMYHQDPYQKTYQHQHHQQAYPDPAIVHAYPDPALVDIPTNTEKPKPTLVTTSKPKSTGRRKKIIWA
ncbi:hypothetical protein BGZ97_000368 [Linnemannia gamsii]|uniref:Uncharacterized protein n=1 Tax=Linnemannia gamsii TaxID=64522 RepID=A0A9P6R0I8_9FUNG|nr:hypothetical protein BGZ97_000368 [Linnemannia gamsii]